MTFPVSASGPYVYWRPDQTHDNTKSFSETVTGYTHDGPYESSYEYNIMYCVQPFEAWGDSCYCKLDKPVARQIIEFLLTEFKPLIESPLETTRLLDLGVRFVMGEKRVEQVHEYVLLEREDRGVKCLLVKGEGDSKETLVYNQHFLMIPGQYLSYLFGVYWPALTVTSTAIAPHERFLEVFEEARRELDASSPAVTTYHAAGALLADIREGRVEIGSFDPTGDARLA